MLSKFVWPLNSDSVHQLCWQSFQPAANDPSLMSLPGRSPNGSDQRQGTNSRRIHDAVYRQQPSNALANRDCYPQPSSVTTARHHLQSGISHRVPHAATADHATAQNLAPFFCHHLMDKHLQVPSRNLPYTRTASESTRTRPPWHGHTVPPKKSIPVGPVWARYPQPATARQVA